MFDLSILSKHLDIEVSRTSLHVRILGFDISTEWGLTIKLGRRELFICRDYTERQRKPGLFEAYEGSGPGDWNILIFRRWDATYSGNRPTGPFAQ